MEGGDARARLDRAGLGKKGAGAARGRVRWHYRPTPATPELDDADRAVQVALLKQTTAADPLPLSPWIRTAAISPQREAS
jgi:hypothetical protein